MRKFEYSLEIRYYSRTVFLGVLMILQLYRLSTPLPGDASEIFRRVCYKLYKLF